MKRKSADLVLQSMCGQPGPEDGLDPRDYFKPARQRRDSRKDWQVCRQVFETLNYVLSGDGRDEILGGLIVAEVAPAPDATRLLVVVEPLDQSESTDPVLILQHLKQATGRLRAAVASSISRRKVPELIFQLADRLPPTGPQSGLDGLATDTKEPQ